MDRSTFLKSLAGRLNPILRSEGFRGSGNTLRRIIGEVVHVFNVQSSSGGESCYLNLGAHLLFLPKPGGGVSDASTLKEFECAFRDRFDPPSGSSTGWSFGGTMAEMNESIDFICEHWAIYGHGFFDQYMEYPTSFISLIERTDTSTTHPIELLTLARIAHHLRDGERCVSFATDALRRCPEQATDLQARLEEIIELTTRT